LADSSGRPLSGERGRRVDDWGVVGAQVQVARRRRDLWTWVNSLSFVRRLQTCSRRPRPAREWYRQSEDMVVFVLLLLLLLTVLVVFVLLVSLGSPGFMVVNKKERKNMTTWEKRQHHHFFLFFLFFSCVWEFNPIMGGNGGAFWRFYRRGALGVLSTGPRVVGSQL